jgi:hypothetical protein
MSELPILVVVVLLPDNAVKLPLLNVAGTPTLSKVRSQVTVSKTLDTIVSAVTVSEQSRYPVQPAPVHWLAGPEYQLFGVPWSTMLVPAEYLCEHVPPPEMPLPQEIDPSSVQT